MTTSFCRPSLNAEKAFVDWFFLSFNSRARVRSFGVVGRGLLMARHPLFTQAPVHGVPLLRAVRALAGRGVPFGGSLPGARRATSPRRASRVRSRAAAHGIRLVPPGQPDDVIIGELDLERVLHAHHGVVPVAVVEAVPVAADAVVRRHVPAKGGSSDDRVPPRGGGRAPTRGRRSRRRSSAPTRSSRSRARWPGASPPAGCRPRRCARRGSRRRSGRTRRAASAIAASTLLSVAFHSSPAEAAPAGAPWRQSSAERLTAERLKMSSIED